MTATTIAPSRRRLPVPVRILAALIAGGVLLAGIWVAGGLITSDFITSMILTAAWVAFTGLACVVLVLRRRELWPVLAAFVVTAAAAGVYLGTQTLIDREVHEDVVTAGAPANVLLGQGRFQSLEHGTSGVAQTIEVRGDRRVLTLTEFKTSAGPDLRVYLSTADASESSSGDDHVDLGALKGNAGEQQYDLPRGVNLDRFTTVLIWCRAFSVGFGAAPLEVR
jgi:hypothetical protein